MHRDRDQVNQYQRQLELYAHLVEQRTGEKVSRMHLYYTGETEGHLTYRLIKMSAVFKIRCKSLIRWYAVLRIKIIVCVPALIGYA